MKENWIKTGYEMFAISGHKELKVEVLAKKLGISKSSFYYHFAEMDIFIEHLFDYHLTQSKVIAQKETAAEKIDPDLIDILVEHKIDLLFNRQLRINQHMEWHKTILARANEITGKAHLKLFAKGLQLKITSKQLEGLLELALENFFLQINQDNLNHAWLRAYFDNFRTIAKNFE